LLECTRLTAATFQTLAKSAASLLLMTALSEEGGVAAGATSAGRPKPRERQLIAVLRRDILESQF
jgi:hypothetical protein